MLKDQDLLYRNAAKTALRNGRISSEAYRSIMNEYNDKYKKRSIDHKVIKEANLKLIDKQLTR